MKPYEIIEQLNSASDKKTLITAAWDVGCIEFFKGYQMCFNPYINFGNFKVPEFDDNGDDSLDDLFSVDSITWMDFENFITGIETRQITEKNIKSSLVTLANKATTKEWNLWYRPIMLRDLHCNLRTDEYNNILNGIGVDAYKFKVPNLNIQCPAQITEIPPQYFYVDRPVDTRLVAIINNKNVSLHLSYGKNVTKYYSDIRASIEKMIPNFPGNIVFDGGVDSKKNFAVFDVIPFDDFVKGSCSISLKDRQEILMALQGMFAHFTDGVVYTSVKKIINFSRDNWEDDLLPFIGKSNTIIIKDADAGYEAGSNSNWMLYTLPETISKKGSTMTSTIVYDIIENIASDPSKNAKEKMVIAAANNDLFVRVLEYTYNPFKTFGIIPSRPNSTGNAVFDDTTWDILDRLIARKLTGNESRDVVNTEMNRLDTKSADLFWRIIRKDLRAGFSESTINKAIKGLIPEFPYCRCCLPKDAKLENWDWVNGVYSQEKADGMFANMNVETGGLVTITSRQGSPFPIGPFGDLINEIVTTIAPETQIHGELLVLRDGVILPREQGNGILNKVLKGGDFASNEKPYYSVWDQIPLSEVKAKGKYNVPYKERYNKLLSQLKSSLTYLGMIPTRIVHSMEEAFAHYKYMLSLGKEGTIIKNPSAVWRDGTSKEQCKMKLEITVDLRIKEFLAGNGKNADTFGSVLCQSEDALLEVAVSGFSDKLRERMHKDRENLIDTIMAVKANAIMTPQKDGDKYSLFLPRCAELRMDKHTADTLKQIQDQFDAAIL